MDVFNTVSQYFRQWFALLPFSRKDQYADMFLNPKSHSKYASASTISQGLFDWAVGLFPIHILSVFNYLISVIINPLFTLTFIAMYAVAVPFVSFIQTFLFSGAEFLVAKLLGGKGTYSNHFGLTSAAVASTSLAMLPLYAFVAILGNVPFINCLTCFLLPVLIGIAVWSLYLRIQSIAAVHTLSMLKAVIVFIVPAILFSVVFALAYLVFVVPFLVSQMPPLAATASGVAP